MRRLDLTALVLAATSGCSAVFPLEDAGCPASYTIVSGASRYRRMAQHTTFSAAAEACFTEGTHLVVLSNDAERMMLGTMIGSIGEWIGLHDRNDDAQFTILSDEDVNGYPPSSGDLWLGGGLNGANCVALEAGGLFTGSGCMDPRPSTCECDGYRGNDNWRDNQ